MKKRITFSKHGVKTDLLEKCINENLVRLRVEIKKFTQLLIRVPTENPPGRNYREFIELIDKKFIEFGLPTRKIEIKKPKDDLYPRYALIATFGKGKKTIYFHGHYDVVPAANKAQFKPTTRGDRLYGRGAADMKGGLVSMIYAIRVLQLCRLELAGRINLIIVPDEETGGKYGTEYLFEYGFIKRKSGLAMFMPEPTSGAIWNACRGAISLRLKIKGKAVHVTMQQQGINAYEQMLIVADELLALKSQVEKRKTDYNVGPEESRNSILMLGGSCSGGTNFNIVPGECSFTIERRINPEEDFTMERTKLIKLLEKFKRKGIDLEIEVIQEGESAGISSNVRAAKTLAACIQKIEKIEPEFRMCPGLLEIRFYLKQGIPAFAYGPGLLSAAHGPNEFINMKSVYKCAAIYALIATRLFAEA